jgi:hypothetical protein
MSDARVRVRANRSTGELEIEGPLQAVTEWWDKLWPELNGSRPIKHVSGDDGRGLSLPMTTTGGQSPELFGEFYTEFRSGITDVDRVLIAAAFVQGREQERTFSTKAANQVLLDQNIKVANASESVRRLSQTKRVFVVSDGKFRVSSSGFEHLQSLKMNPQFTNRLTK